MSKKVAETESESLEIIELCIDDLDLLSRAFDLIADACDQEASPEPRTLQAVPARLLN